MVIDELKKFRIPGNVDFTQGAGALPKIHVSTNDSDAEIYLHGGHVTSFIPKGNDDYFWLSPLSPFGDGKAIRGGIPLCFPWFGNHRVRKDFPAHGFVRTKEWNMESSALLSDGRVCIVLSTSSDEKTQVYWPYDFRLELRITVGPELELELIATNTGSKPFSYEDCFHTYFYVKNVECTKVSGLEQLWYLDRLAGDKHSVLPGTLKPAGPVTALFPRAPAKATIHGETSERTIIGDQSGFNGTVVWTPWSGAETSFADIGAGWKNFLCLEAVNFGDYAISLLPGTSHRSAVRYGSRQPQE
jgi:glucose-6-phosphate 1-epimerase